MPFDVPVRTLNIDATPDLRVAPSTPAIQALMDGVRQGAITFDDINKHFSQGVDESADLTKKSLEKRKASDELDLQGQIQALRKQNLDLAQQIQPLVARKTVADAGTGAITAEGNLATAPKAVTVQARGADSALATSADEAVSNQITDPNADKGEVQNIQDFRKVFGVNPPRNPDGGIDHAATAESLNRYRDAVVARAGAKSMTPSDEALFKEAIRKHVENQVYDTQSKMLKPGAAEIIANAPEPRTQPEIDQSQGAIRSIDATLDPSGNIATARKYVNDAETNPVGPGFTEGNAVNRAVVQGAAAVGLKTKKFQQQNELNMTLAKGILSDIKSFAGTGVGQIRNTEIEQMQKGQPTLSSTPETWNKWLDTAESLLKNARQDHFNRLPENYQTGFQTSPAIKVTPPPAAPATQVPGRPPGVNSEGFIPTDAPEFSIQSKVAVPWPGISQFNKLQPGQPYYDNRGKLRIKG